MWVCDIWIRIRCVGPVVWCFCLSVAGVWALRATGGGCFTSRDDPKCFVFNVSCWHAEVIQKTAKSNFHHVKYIYSDTRITFQGRWKLWIDGLAHATTQPILRAFGKSFSFVLFPLLPGFLLQAFVSRCLRVFWNDPWTLQCQLQCTSQVSTASMIKENVLKKSSNISSMIEDRHAGRNVKTYS